MEKAKQLLSDPKYKISEISSKVGYTDGNYFGKSFKNTPAFPRLNTGRKCHEGPLAPFQNGYLNLNLQTKFTIALISIVVIPACLTAFLFYGRLYSMVVSNTIRQEQDASAKTAPLIERTMDTILATTRNITGQNFFRNFLYAGQRFSRTACNI
ncbi:MAG: helix-turn-helix domain-containing protein [Blautia massiliensis (ex Durand et al. 2017)]